MKEGFTRLKDFLPVQDHYWVLGNDERYADFGGDVDHTGLLVFENLERAEQFMMTVLKQDTFGFVPEQIDIFDLIDLIDTSEQRICKWTHTSTSVATIHWDGEDGGE